MANPLIDNLSWDPDNPAASIRTLQTNLNALQAEWQTKLTRVVDVSSVNFVDSVFWKSQALSKGISLNDINAYYRWFDPTNPGVFNASRYIRNLIQGEGGFRTLGESYFFSTEGQKKYAIVGATGASDTLYTTDISVEMLYPGYIRGHHVLRVAHNIASGGSAIDLLFQPQINATDVFSSTDGDPGLVWRREAHVPIEEPELVILEWVSGLLTAGTKAVNVIMDPRGSGGEGGYSVWSVHPIVAADAAVDPTLARHDQLLPDPSFLEVIYQ